MLPLHRGTRIVETTVAVDEEIREGNGRGRTRVTSSPHRLSLERIEQAARIIDPVFLHSPQFVCEPLGDELGVRLVLKIETLNPLRSFKGRGADYCISQLPADARLVCASAGNFGQAMAYACRKRSLALTVYASVNANPFKVERMRALGANVVLHGEDFDAAKIEARRFASQSGARMIEDSLDPATGEGRARSGLNSSRFPIISTRCSCRSATARCWRGSPAS